MSITINQDAKGVNYVNYDKAHQFNIPTPDGERTKGKRVYLTAGDGVPRMNFAIATHELVEMAEQAEAHGAEVIQFSAVIERTSKFKKEATPWTQLSSLIEKMQVRPGRLVTRLQEFRK